MVDIYLLWNFVPFVCIFWTTLMFTFLVKASHAHCVGLFFSLCSKVTALNCLQKQNIGLSEQFSMSTAEHSSVAVLSWSFYILTEMHSIKEFSFLMFKYRLNFNSWSRQSRENAFPRAEGNFNSWHFCFIKEMNVISNSYICAPLQ